MVELLQEALRIHHTFRKCVGLGDVQPHRRRLNQAYGIAVLGFLLIFQLAVYLNLQEARTILDAMTVLSPAVILTLIIVKYVLFALNRSRTESALALMRELEQGTVSTTADRAVMRRAITYSHWVVMTAFWSCFVITVLRFVVSMIVGKRELMFPATLPGDWLNVYPLYCLYNCAQLVLTILGCLCLGTLDTFGPTMYLLLDAFVEILCGKLQRLCNENHDDGNIHDINENDRDRCLNDLIECIEIHQKCLRWEQ